MSKTQVNSLRLKNVFSLQEVLATAAIFLIRFLAIKKNSFQSTSFYVRLHNHNE